MTLFNTLFWTSVASSVCQKADLSHASVAENKGDDTLCTKKGQDQRVVMKLIAVEGQLSLQKLWGLLGPGIA